MLFLREGQVMNGVEAMHEVDGLRTAKRIVRKQTAVVKGERGEFARGYRRAINDLIAVIRRGDR